MNFWWVFMVGCFFVVDGMLGQDWCVDEGVEVVVVFVGVDVLQFVVIGGVEYVDFVVYLVDDVDFVFVCGDVFGVVEVFQCVQWCECGGVDYGDVVFVLVGDVEQVVFYCQCSVVGCFVDVDCGDDGYCVWFCQVDY